jgi:ferric-dicitrate binding protein FerR (iron transport regulator)
MNEENLNKEALALLDDNSFIRYLKGTPNDNDKNWKEWIDEHSEREEIVKAAITVFQNIYHEENGIDGETKNSIWQKIDQNTKSEKVEFKLFPMKTIRKLVYISAAACLLFFAISRFNSVQNEYQTDYGDVELIKLPDNSVINLNAKSKLSIEKEDFLEKRVVELEGEAFFNVTKGESFNVLTKFGNIAVLGTSFNVYARDDRFFVECKTGKVEVSKDDKIVLLSPGDGAYWEPIVNNLILYNTGKTTRDEWMKGQFSYKNQKLITVLKELERQYGVSIDIAQNLGELSYSGFFTSNDLEEALQSICWPMHLKWDINNKTIKIVKD